MKNKNEMAAHLRAAGWTTAYNTDLWQHERLACVDLPLKVAYNRQQRQDEHCWETLQQTVTAAITAAVTPSVPALATGEARNLNPNSLGNALHGRLNGALSLSTCINIFKQDRPQNVRTLSIACTALGLQFELKA